MAVMEVSINPPKIQKRASKKNKKSWRKNTDLEEVEDFLEDQRLEERLGGAFDKRSDSDLFVVDNSSKTPECGIDTTVNLSKKEARKKNAREKTLKCFSNLDVEKNSGIQDPKKGRDSRKTPEERKNPVLKRKEEELAKAGIIREKMVTAMKQREKQKDRKKATQLSRTTRRRTKFDFDLWDTNVVPENNIREDEANHKEIDNNEWLEQQTKDHNLNNTRQMKKKPPTDFYLKETSLSAVEIPHGGTSYNPSYKEHQDLLWKAAMVELNKEKEQHKLDYHSTHMYPKSSDAPNESTYITEMSEGIEALEKDKDSEENVEESPEDIDEEPTKVNKLKTKKQRRDALKLKMEKKRMIHGKREKMKVLDVFKTKTMNKEIKAEEKKTVQKVAKRKEQKVLKKSMPAYLTGHKFEEQDLDLKLSDELKGSLMSLKPEGNLLNDRFKSMQKRNLIETRVKHKIVKNRRKRKLQEKRSYKMGFEWEKSYIKKK